MTDIASGLAPDEASSLMAVLLAELTAGVGVFDAGLRLRATSAALGVMLGLPEALTRPGVTLAEIMDHAVDQGLTMAPETTLALFHQPLGGSVTWIGAADRHLELTVRPLDRQGRLALWRDVTERDRDRETLREERARTRHMLRHVTDAIVLMDPDGVILENSDRSGRLLAVPPELVVPGQTHQNILRHLYRRGDYGFDLSEADFIAGRRADVLAAGDLTFTAPMPNGVWAEYNFRPMPDGHMLIIVRDVTELKQQEQALVRARDAQALEGERLNAILDHLPDGVALTEADGELVHMNAASHELNHFPPLEAGRIRTMRDAMRWQLEHAEEPPGAAEIEADLDRRMALFAASGRNRREILRHGRYLDIRWIPLPGGRRLILHRDITELRQQGQELEKTRDALALEGERLNTILDNLPDGVALYAANGDILHLNAACYELNRFPRAVFASIRNLRDGLRWQIGAGQAPMTHATIEEELDHRMAVFFRDERCRHERHRYGRYLDVHWIPLPDGRRLVLHRDITELREREIELRHAHEAIELAHGQMYDVLDSMIDGVSLFGADGEILFVNRPFQTINKIPNDMFTGLRDLRDGLRWQLETGEIARTHPTIEEDVAALYAPFIERKPRYHVRQTRDGRWIDVHWLPLPRGRMLAIHRDVTELKQREQAAAESRALMETVLDNMTDGVMLYDSAETCVYANKSFYRLNEASPERIAGLRTFPAMMKALRESGAIDDAFLIAGLERFRLADGTPRLRRSLDERWSEAAFHKLADGGTLGIFRDVTDFIRNETALRDARAASERQREIMRVMFDNMTDGLVLAEADGAWTLVNNALYKINGWPVDTPSNSCLEADVRAMLERGLLERRLPTIEEDVVRVRRRFIEADGSPVDFHRSNGSWVEVRWIVLPDDRRLGMYRDITALKQQEERLALERDAAEAARREAEAANQAKSTFLAAMSHEIRTPMNGVLGMMEVLERTELSNEQQHHVSIIRDSAQSLLRIIDDILDFSKIDAGRMELESLPFSLHGLIGGAVDTFSPQARRKGLALFADPPGPGPDWVDGDPTRVRQILFNLIGNALKFTERGFVRISAAGAATDGQAAVTLTVEDSGIGMDTVQLARLFQPFSQGDTSTTRRFGGTGLGLSIVRRLAELMGGSAAADSTPGRGSRFIVTLRFGLASAPAADILPLVPPRVADGADRPRLLVADDHPVNREVIQQQLGLLGLSADLAADGREALDLWRQHRHGVVLLDIHMPELDGFDVARAIRREEAALGLKRGGLIAVTANALKGEDERCFAAGMDGFVAKPVSLDMLSRALSRFVPGLGTSVASAPSGGAFDPEALRGLFGSDPARLSRLFETFVDSAMTDLVTLRTAPTAAALAEAAHRLKGAARMVGARILADQASRVETAAREGDAAAAFAASETMAAMLVETTEAARASFAAGQIGHPTGR